MGIRHIGPCRICGQKKALSFEHVPPKTAYNRRIRFISYPWIESLTKTNVRRTIIQGGLGDYTLCGECNTRVGRYAREYKMWVIKIIDSIRTLKHPYKKWAGILHEVYPLRFIKQVVAMFCSLNGRQFVEKRPELKDYLLDKDKRGIPCDVSILMYMNFNKYISRSSVVGLIDFKNPVPGRSVTLLNETNFPPFGFRCAFGYQGTHVLTDITWFDQYRYDEKENIYLELPVLERNTAIPNDYRTEFELQCDQMDGLIKLYTST